MNRSHTPEDVEKIQSGWRKRQIQRQITMDDDDIQDYVRPWKRLTDEEIQKALGVTAESSNWNMIMVLEWARKIEAALLEKNNG